MHSHIKLELQSLLASRGLWVLWLLTGPLVGFSLIQAISLYNEVSRTALAVPQMAAGLNPFDGVIIPAYGSIYLTLTLLFPFIAIRTISEDKHSGALRLLLQIPFRQSALLSSKVAAMLFAWLFVELPGLLALLLYRKAGRGEPRRRVANFSRVSSDGTVWPFFTREM
jgi:ABC-2 type transport system permease protein